MGSHRQNGADVLKRETYIQILKAASETTKFAKRLSEETLALLWITTPAKTRNEVTDEMLAYAFNQMRIDPNPPEDLGIDQQLYSYVYRCRDGFPAFDWGLKADLPERMATGAFNPQPSSQYALGEDLTRPEENCSNGVLRLFGGNDG